MNPKTHCTKPDRDVPKIECGYPLPCPHHTAVIDISGEEIKVTVPHGMRSELKEQYSNTVHRFIDIGKAIKRKK